MPTPIAILFITLTLSACSDSTRDTRTSAGQELDAQARATVARLGGTVEATSTEAGAPLVKVDLHGTAVTDADVATLVGLDALRTLDLRLTQVGDAAAEEIAQLEGLQSLNLFRTRLTDRGFAALMRLDSLDTLLIGGTQVTDASLSQLGGLTRLRKLSLFDTRITDVGLQHLIALPSLQVVLIGKSDVSEAGLAAFARARPDIRFSEET